MQQALKLFTIIKLPKALHINAKFAKSELKTLLKLWLCPPIQNLSGFYNEFEKADTKYYGYFEKAGAIYSLTKAKIKSEAYKNGK